MSWCYPGGSASSYTAPTVTNFKDYFNRDFPYGSTDVSVMDSDIVKALADTGMFINPSLFNNQGQYTIGYLNLAGHFLCINIQASSQGIAGQFEWLVTAKSVGNVSESFQIPQRILDNPEFAMLSSTRYGAKFLFMILPALVGQMFISPGRTNP